MKRDVVFLLFVFVVSILLASCGQSPLSEAEREKRAEDYALLIESLKSVGYDAEFALKESNSIEDNLRRLWLREQAFNDARKNAELMVLLRNFNFIAEGLQTKASNYIVSDNPYYDGWPRDSRYRAASSAAEFSAEEVLWLMMLLQDADIPEAHSGLRDVLLKCGEEVLSWQTNDYIWIHFEKTSPGLLERLDPEYWERYVPVEMAAAYRDADEAIQDRFIQAIDMADVRESVIRPRLNPSFSEMEAWMREFLPTGSWDGGYIRVVSPRINRYSARMAALKFPSIYEYRSSYALAAVTNPADARFAVYEEYTDRAYFDTYYWDDTGEPVDIFLWQLNIRIVDLLTGEEILSETVRGNPPPEKVSFLAMFRIEASGGEYDHDDFDYDRYAAVMMEHMKSR